MMGLIEAFGLRDKEIVSFAGGGGKTTYIRLLANELKLAGKKSLVTTTTHMYPEGCTITDHDEDRLYNILKGIPDDYFPVMCGSSINTEGKVCAVTDNFVEILNVSGSFPYILIEADGSRGRPIKAFESYEPSVPGCTTIYAVVLGLDALGKPLDEKCAHRPEIVSSITGLPLGSLIDKNMIVRLFKDSMGLLKGSRDGFRNIVLFNKADNETLIDKGCSIGEALLLECGSIERIIIGSGLNCGNVFMVMER